MRQRREFTSALRPLEAALVLGWLPAHVYLLPRLLAPLYLSGRLDEGLFNFAVYALGALWMLTVGVFFLRREFDPLADDLFGVAWEAVRTYLAVLLCNLLMGLALERLAPALTNPNNEGVAALVRQYTGPMKASLLILGPILEEMLFRAGVFGVLRQRSRAAAYLVSALVFAVYHVWSFALTEPLYWLLIAEYLPAGLLLARCYERTNTVWASILCHALTNAVSLRMLMMQG